MAGTRKRCAKGTRKVGNDCVNKADIVKKRCPAGHHKTKTRGCVKNSASRVARNTARNVAVLVPGSADMRTPQKAHHKKRAHFYRNDSPAFISMSPSPKRKSPSPKHNDDMFALYHW